MKQNIKITVFVYYVKLFHSLGAAALDISEGPPVASVSMWVVYMWNDPCVCFFSGIHEFPRDVFTEQERMEGAVALHIIGVSVFLFVFVCVCMYVSRIIVSEIKKTHSALMYTNT